MSSKGKPVHAPQTCDGSGKFKYKDAGCLVQDWWATHPRPVVVKTDGDSHLFTEADIEAIRKSDDKDATVKAIIAGDTTVKFQPPYEDENGKTWFHNPTTGLWDIPAPVTNEAPHSSDDVPQV